MQLDWDASQADWNCDGDESDTGGAIGAPGASIQLPDTSPVIDITEE